MHKHFCFHLCNTFSDFDATTLYPLSADICRFRAAFNKRRSLCIILQRQFPKKKHAEACFFRMFFYCFNSGLFRIRILC